METKNTQKVFLTHEDVCNELASYFDGVKVNYVVNIYCGRPIVEIEYEDFKPTMQVRKELTARISNLEIEVLHRGYSNDTYLDLIKELIYEEDKQYVISIPGSNKVQAVSMSEILLNRLYCRTIN